MDTSITVDKMMMYRSVVVNVLEEYHRLNLQAESELESMLVCDDHSQNYLLVLAGWQGQKRIKQVQLHLRLRTNQVWIEEDWTEDGIMGDLIRSGVDRESIVLGFLPPQVRKQAVDYI